MKNIFVSSQRIDNERTKCLISKLRNIGFNVYHSPRNPIDGEDKRWKSWYNSGLNGELDKSDTFIIVVDSGWDSSIWMGEEAENALNRKKAGKIKNYFFYNPENIEVKAMNYYLLNKLQMILKS